MTQQREQKEPPRKFEVLEHTADVLIAAYGETLAELFENAAYGMVSVSYDPESVRRERLAPVRVQAGALPDALVAWLKEVVFLGETEEMAFGVFQAEVSRGLESIEVSGRLWGQPWGENVRRRGAVVKAV